MKADGLYNREVKALGESGVVLLTCSKAKLKKACAEEGHLCLEQKEREVREFQAEAP